MSENYLNEFYINEEKLVKKMGVTIETLRGWQDEKIFPKPSYVTETETTISSFFGQHRYRKITKWYPDQLDEWGFFIKNHHFSKDLIEMDFKNGYMNTIIGLRSIGVYDSIYEDICSKEMILNEVWGHFLDGIYGICTKNCTPEQIATKDVATYFINVLTDQQKKIMIAENDKAKLVIALDLLDSVTSFFAPHERHQCSRNQCINAVRKKYLCVG